MVAAAVGGFVVAQVYAAQQNVAVAVGVAEAEDTTAAAVHSLVVLYFNKVSALAVVVAINGHFTLGVAVFTCEDAAAVQTGFVVVDYGF